MSKQNQWVFPFGPGQGASEPADKDLLGGKGASLAALSRAGLPVPPGFTISTACCRFFFEHGQQWPPGLEEEVRINLARLEEITGRRFGKGRQPLLVSVRSGAAVSMPGMMDTLLNCGLHPGLADDLGDTSEFWSLYLEFLRAFARIVAGIAPEVLSAGSDTSQPASRELIENALRIFQDKTGRPFPTEPWTLLCECINAVFRSWNTERAVAYRQRHELGGPGGTAVNVQAMYPSQVSGILFTQDPNDPGSGRMVLEASFGLGESVVSGEVTPDRFLVARDNFAEIQTFLGNKSRRVAALGAGPMPAAHEASLTAEQIGTLCATGLRIAQLFGRPMDIEWGLAGEELAVLQCRPIRGLEVAQDVEIGRVAEIERLKSLSAGRRRIWVAHNLGETLRAPTPLTWDIVSHFMSGAGGFGGLYQDLGFRPSPLVCREGFLELIAGRIYADPERLAQFFWGDGPFQYDLDAVWHDSSLLDQAPTKLDPTKVGGRFILRLPGLMYAMYRAGRISHRLRHSIQDFFEKEALPPYLDYVQKKRAEDLTHLETPQVISELRARCSRVLDEYGKESLKPGYFGALAFADLRRLLLKLLGPERGNQLACTLTGGLEGDTTVAQNQFLYQVANGESTLEQFLEAYGHRTAGEMELAEPRFRENPGHLERSLAALRRCGRSPQEIHQEHASRRAEIEKGLPHLLASCGGTSFQKQIDDYLRQAQALLAYREAGKHYLMMGYELLRQAILELARRWQLGRDVFFLRLEELERFEKQREELLETAAQRLIRWQSFQRLDLPAAIDSRNLDRLGIPQTYESAEELQGEPVAGGVATGTARVVFDPGEERDLGSEFILVCPSTDPGWTALFVNARGLIVERGGVLSHGAIVARDFAIPAVVCAGATSRIKDGSTLQLDGNRGVIGIMEGLK